MATDNVTSGYSFPAGGGHEGGGGLVDVSAPGAGVSATHATPAMQEALQQFFQERSRASGEAAPPPAPEAGSGASGEQGPAAAPDA